MCGPAGRRMRRPELHAGGSLLHTRSVCLPSSRGKRTGCRDRAQRPRARRQRSAIARVTAASARRRRSRRACRISPSSTTLGEDGHPTLDSSAVHPRLASVRGPNLEPCGATTHWAQTLAAAVATPGWRCVLPGAPSTRQPRGLRRGQRSFTSMRPLSVMRYMKCGFVTCLGTMRRYSQAMRRFDDVYERKPCVMTRKPCNGYECPTHAQAALATRASTVPMAMNDCHAAPHPGASSRRAWRCSASPVRASTPALTIQAVVTRSGRPSASGLHLLRASVEQLLRPRDDAESRIRRPGRHGR